MKWWGYIVNALAKLWVFTRYRLKVEGLDEIERNNDKRPILFLSSHPCFADPIITVSLIWFKHKPKPLISTTELERPVFKQILSTAYKPVGIPDIQKHGRGQAQAAKQAIETIGMELQKGSNILLHPAGRLTRTGYEDLGTRSAAASIMQYRPDTRIVLMRYVGLWGSHSGRYLWNAPPPVVKLFAQAFLSFIVNLMVFIPKHPVKVVFKEVTDFPTAGSRLEINNYLEQFFNEEYQPIVKVPLFWWQKKEILPNTPPPLPVGYDKLNEEQKEDHHEKT